MEEGTVTLVTGFRTERIRRDDADRALLVAEDGRELDPADTVVVLTGFRPDLGFLSEMRLDLDPVLQAPSAIAPSIDPNVHSCGTATPTLAADLAQPEPGLYLVGMKSYGRAPTFLAMTGYEQVRSVAAELAGDHEAAARSELVLPDTGVCGGAGLFDDPDGASGGGVLRACPASAADRPRPGPRLTPMAQAPAAETPATGRAAGDAPAPGGARRRALAALCVTEIVSYGVIYYAFPVLATQIAAGTGWSRTAVTLAYSAGNLAGALAGIPAGRLIQRHGPRPVMTAGSVLGALAVAGIAAAPDYGLFAAAWVVAGIATAGLYYPPAFAALTTWYGPRRVAALTTLTLAAGFASTIFAPLTSALAGPLGWRGTYLLLAAVLAAVTVPAHALFLRLPWTRRPPARARPGPRAAPTGTCWQAGRSCCSSRRRRCARSPSTPPWSTWSRCSPAAA